MGVSRSCLRPIWLAWVCSLLCFISTTWAALFEPKELRPVVVTGNVSPRTQGSEIAATSILTRTDIERAGARDLVSALNLLGTSLVEQQGGPGAASVVRLRGADSRDTLILVDGIPLTDVTSGQASLSQMPVDNIERIEVVRGNLSALYGANATGGVIQVFTRRGSRVLDAQVQVGVGSRGTRYGNISAAGGSEILRTRLTFGGERTDGVSAANPALALKANPDADGNRRRDAAIALDAHLAPGQSVGIDLRIQSGTVEYDNTAFGALTDTHGSHILQRGTTVRGQHRMNNNWSFAWRGADTDENRSDTLNGVFAFENVLRNRVAAADLIGSLAPRWAVRLGAERFEQSTENTTYSRSSRHTNTLRAGTRYDGNWGSVQGNIRHDRTSDFGTANTALLGGKLRLGKHLSGIALWSSSFTPPTLDFLFFDCSPFVCSNPYLGPEQSRNIDLGLQWDNTATLLRATLFSSRYRDKIANDSSFVPHNVNRAKNNGVELTARTTLGSCKLGAEVVFQNPVNEVTGVRLIRRARQQLALYADYDAVVWFARGGLRHVGERHDGPDSSSMPLPSYTVFDLRARWVLTSEWSVRVTVDNLFDHQYQPTAGYAGPPRGMFFTLNWQLN